ncbi:hypothetical protein Tco_0339358 [Tanacetum coccineum]
MVKNLDNLSGKFDVSKSSSPTEHVADEAVYKEFHDSLVRAATTASSLEAQHESVNIIKSRSKATPNEVGSQGTTSGGSPRRQETMGDTTARTRFESVSKISNDPLLARGNILQSGKDILKLNKLMEFCTNLQTRVLNLEKTKTTQAKDIVSLKRRVKKLEQKKRSRTHGLKRLYKVGLTARVESSGDKEDLGEDASKHGRRIHDIDADEDITLVNDQDDANMFNVNALAGEEVFVAEQSGNVVEEVGVVIDAASTIPVSAALITDVKITLAQALTELKSAKPKADKVVIQKPEQGTTTTTPTTIISISKPPQDKGKGIMIEEPVLQAEESEEERLAKEKAQQIKEANIAWDDVQAKMFDRAFKRVNILVDFRTDLVEGSSKRARTELEQENEEEVAINVVPLATKPPTIVDWKIHKEGKKSYYQIIRADGKSQMYRVFSQILKSFSREDLKDLYKLVKAKYGSTRPLEDLDLILYGDLKTMFEPHVEDQVWKNQDDYKVLDWKLYDSCGVYSLRMQHVYIHMLVEKRYPLKPSTITDMLNKKLQVDYLNEMAYQLLKLLTK